jgi:hypothetical protein
VDVAFFSMRFDDISGLRCRIESTSWAAGH